MSILILLVPTLLALPAILLMYWLIFRYPETPEPEQGRLFPVTAWEEPTERTYLELVYLSLRDSYMSNRYAPLRRLLQTTRHTCREVSQYTTRKVKTLITPYMWERKREKLNFLYSTYLKPSIVNTWTSMSQLLTALISKTRLMLLRRRVSAFLSSLQKL
jgi:hypothetical protein